MKACVRARATWVCLSVLSFDIGKLQGEEGVTGKEGACTVIPVRLPRPVWLRFGYYSDSSKPIIYWAPAI